MLPIELQMRAAWDRQSCLLQSPQPNCKLQTSASRQSAMLAASSTPSTVQNYQIAAIRPPLQAVVKVRNMRDPEDIWLKADYARRPVKARSPAPTRAL